MCVCVGGLRGWGLGKDTSIYTRVCVCVRVCVVCAERQSSKHVEAFVS